MENPREPPDANRRGNAGDEAVKPESLTRGLPTDTAQPFGPSKHTIRVNEQERGQEEGAREHRWLRRDRGHLPNKEARDREEEFRVAHDCAPENSRETGQRGVQPNTVPVPVAQTAQSRPSPHTARKPQDRHLAGQLWLICSSPPRFAVRISSRI